jgi:hypothetical protein
MSAYRKMTRRPTTPGEILHEEFLKPFGMSLRRPASGAGGTRPTGSAPAATGSADRHGVRLLKEQRNEGLEPGPDGARAALVVVRHARRHLEEVPRL